MNKTLLEKVKHNIRLIREMYKRTGDLFPFIAFSTGKDSLAMSAMLYEAIPDKKIPCVYVHHNLEFPENIEYSFELKQKGFDIHIVKPFLEHFELQDEALDLLL